MITLASGKFYPPLSDRIDKYYLPYSGAKNLDIADYPQRKVIFLLVLKDFLSEVISLDDVSSIANRLLKNPGELSSSDERELNDTIYCASEFAFQSRRFPIAGDAGGNLVSFLTEVKDYYLKYSKWA